MQRLDVGQKILSENDRCALENSHLLAEKRLVCFNLISSPGSGKTSLLVRTIQELAGQVRIGVIEGDIQTEGAEKNTRYGRRAGENNRGERNGA